MSKKYNVTFFKKLSDSTLSIEIRVLAKSLTNAQDKACYKLDLLYGKELFLRNQEEDILILTNYIVDIDVLKNNEADEYSQNQYSI